MSVAELLFSYGTLQLEAVQMATFGRIPESYDDSALCYTLSYVEIKDKAVLALSEQQHHPIAIYTGNPVDAVAGKVFEITMEELLRSDEYEVDDYTRVVVDLKSGGQAWMYVSNNRN